MEKKNIIISIIIFVLVFLLVSFLLINNKSYNKMNIYFYPDPYNYTINISNDTLYIYLNDIQLPYINTSKIYLNISNNIYYPNCLNNIIYQNQSTVCTVNISIKNITYIQLLYPYDNVLYNIVYQI